MSAASAAMFEERIDAGRLSSFLLAATVHLLLFAVLVFGVQWQNRPPEAIQVELWTEPVAEPKPAVEAVQPEPAPAPVVKAEPVTPKPDIAEKAPPPKPLAKVEPKPAPVPKVVPKPAARVEPAKPRPEDTRRMQQELAREQASLAEKQQIRDQLARESASAHNRAMLEWSSKVSAKVRSNVVLPPEIKGNPEAIFDVVQLPTGEVLSVKLRKSSGHPALDSAIERAILKSSPLPRPDRSESAPRAFELKYRPLD